MISPVEGWQIEFIEDEFTKVTIICDVEPIYKHVAMNCLMKFGEYTDIVLTIQLGT